MDRPGDESLADGSEANGAGCDGESVVNPVGGESVRASKFCAGLGLHTAEFTSSTPQVFAVYWSSPESGGLWYNSMQLKPIWRS